MSCPANQLAGRRIKTRTPGAAAPSVLRNHAEMDLPVRRHNMGMDPHHRRSHRRPGRRRSVLRRSLGPHPGCHHRRDQHPGEFRLAALLPHLGRRDHRVRPLRDLGPHRARPRRHRGQRPLNPARCRHGSGRPQCTQGLSKPPSHDSPTSRPTRGGPPAAPSIRPRPACSRLTSASACRPKQVAGSPGQGRSVESRRP